LKLIEKTPWNTLIYGPKALFPLTQPDDVHKYVFVANNAFREVHDLTVLDKLMFGQNMFERDSSYELDPKLVEDIREIAQICHDSKIPLAFYNTPVRPFADTSSDLPYAHRAESYDQVLNIARAFDMPVWNFDRPGLFGESDFQDTYHLTPEGARHITSLLEKRILAWKHGSIDQDSVSTLF
jgi:hypothetical protein